MRILVVEDDLGVQDLIQAWLEPDSHSVSVASGVPQAKELIENKAFDVVLLDNNLSPGCGGDVAEYLEKLGFKGTIVSITGSDKPPAWKHDVHLGKGFGLSAKTLAEAMA